MKQRLNYSQISPKFTQKLMEFSNLMNDCSLERSLIDLCQTRASQMNGCTFCVDMHAKEAKIHGERELRLYHVPVWRESRLFTEKERAALEWTELVTDIDHRGISQADYDRIRTQLSEKEIVDLTFVLGSINAWNRMSVAFHAEHGALDKILGLDKAKLE